ncbi:hypothetical protein K32_30740 [Kaistia sp. 32K]|uniref:hemerythrin domain-containing protein n=1 Tax=Kaistia sp. 32K TaxID=2795690 RepID=UPI001914FD9E|nr:hemerythrin domain-containing protein [Kaistia sp. 32K]BCP54457.1 hypothetical protein K32_30740 [Kaistia sp. 32K]
MTTVYVNETRYNLYASIHKGLRRAQGQLMTRLGAVDSGSEAEVAQLIQDLRLMVEMGRKHLKHEDIYIHTEIEKRSRGATSRLVDDHDHHERDFAELLARLADIEATPADKRSPKLRGLYLFYTGFLADDFEHMIEEETETLSLLHRLFTDGELAAIEGNIVGSVAPDMMMEFIRIMIPAMNPAERLGMLGGMKAAMPVAIFAAIVDMGVKPVLAPADWRALEQALAKAA